MRILLVTCSLTVLLCACVGEMPTAPSSSARVGADSQLSLLKKSLGLDGVDLDSIEVIKGPVASAIYGTTNCSAIIIVVSRRRAAPGVR